MKKTLAALAVLGAFSGAALAQSSVEIYGIVDGGLQIVDPTNNIDSTTGIVSGQQSGSRFGLRGTENLGNGLKAVFVLENGYNLDTGMAGQGGALFGRQAWLGLAGNFGTVAFGRLASLSSGTGSFDMMGSIDPFATGFTDAGAQATFAIGGRVDNGVVYQSGNIAGFKLGAMYSLQKSGAEVAGFDNNTRYAVIAANYTVGKLWTGLSYDTTFYADGTKSDDKTLIVGANYDFGLVKPYVAYSRTEGGLNLGGINTNGTGAKGDSYLIGATAPLFGGTVMGSYQFADVDASATTAAFEREVIAVGYDYSLSKRTNVYGVASFSSGDKALDKVDGANSALVNRNVYQVGIRHKF